MKPQKPIIERREYPTPRSWREAVYYNGLKVIEIARAVLTSGDVTPNLTQLSFSLLRKC
jgi:hypothetical protein